LLIAASLVIGTPFFIVFGALSDKIGRKPIIMLGCLLGAVTYFTVFPALMQYANPGLAKAQASSNVTVTADPATCSFQGSPIAREIDFKSSCDQAKRVLAQNFIPYKNVIAPAGTIASIAIGTATITSLNATLNEKGNGFSAESAKGIAEFKKATLDAAKTAGLTAKAQDETMNKGVVLAILVYLVILVTMVYGPIAAMLVEMFPTRIRYTSMSLPYHIGNGWFGGLLPTTAFAMVAATGDIYYGLWYPVVVAAGTFIIGMIFIKETKDVDIYAND
jgi:Sugar (and other) transporter